MGPLSYLTPPLPDGVKLSLWRQFTEVYFSPTEFQEGQAAQLHTVTWEPRCLRLRCSPVPSGFVVVNVPEAEVPPDLHSSQQDGKWYGGCETCAGTLVPDSGKGLLSPHMLCSWEFSPTATPHSRKLESAGEENCGFGGQPAAFPALPSLLSGVLGPMMGTEGHCSVAALPPGAPRRDRPAQGRMVVVSRASTLV